jgi:hypothetical protein
MKLSDRLSAFNLAAFIAEHHPYAGIDPVRGGSGYASWRGDRKASLHVSKSPGNGVWLYYDFALGEGGNAITFLTRVEGMTLTQARDYLMGKQPWSFMPDAAVTKRSTRKRNSKGKLVARYPYLDDTGELVFQVLRFEPKSFAVRRPHHGQWVYGLEAATYYQTRNGDWVTTFRADVLSQHFPEETRRPLFRLASVLKAKASGEWVLLCAGEKDVLALEPLGLSATTNAFGEQQWCEAQTQALAGAKVIVIADNDKAGLAAGQRRVETLRPFCNVRGPVVMPQGKDPAEFLSRCPYVSRSEFKRLLGIEDSGVDS